MTIANQSEYAKPVPTDGHLDSEAAIPCPHCGRELDGMDVNIDVNLQTVTATATIQYNGRIEYCVNELINSKYIECPHCYADITVDGEFGNGINPSSYCDNI